MILAVKNGWVFRFEGRWFILLMMVCSSMVLSGQSKLIKKAIQDDDGKHFFIKVSFNRFYSLKKIEKVVESNGYFIHKYETKKFEQFGALQSGYSEILITTPALKSKYDRVIAERNIARRQQRAREEEQSWGSLLGALVVIGGVVAAFSDDDSSSSSTTVTYVPFNLMTNIESYDDYENGRGNTVFSVKENPGGNIKLRNVGLYVQYDREDGNWWIVISPPNGVAETLSNTQKTYKYVPKTNRVYRFSEYMSGTTRQVDSHVAFTEAIEVSAQDWINLYKVSANWRSVK